MSKKECDIIRDLLPSYVDNICSPASKEWIAEHLKECKECRVMAKTLKTTEFSAKQLDFAQMDAAKKVKKKQIGNSMIILSLCMFLALVTAVIFSEGNSAVSQLVLYAELPLCIVITWFINKARQATRSWDKWDTVSLMAAVLAISYSIAVMFYVTWKTKTGNTILGMELEEIGPFVSLQMVGCGMVCLVVYVVQMVRLYQKGSINSVIFSLSLLGIFLMLVYGVYLHQLSDVALAVANLNKSTVTVLDVGLVGTAVLAVLDMRSQL